jgi:hypothetical protein
MSGSRLPRLILRVRRSSNCASPAPPKSSITANRPTGSMRWRAKRAISAGPTNASW